jgi:hypothetical protein
MLGGAVMPRHVQNTLDAMYRRRAPAFPYSSIVHIAAFPAPFNCGLLGLLIVAETLATIGIEN